MPTNPFSGVAVFTRCPFYCFYRLPNLPFLFFFHGRVTFYRTKHIYKLTLYRTELTRKTWAVRTFLLW